ncbi:MAG TPA: energy-coupling factor transporter transmembrane component T [Solirubrobacteraceae bacterium]|nr:energy-coupling factor transporter transmembrane component T [Solirubrobacteraceae bacterium]
MIFRPRASPLHAAGAAVACAYCLALVTAALVLSNPVALAALAVAVLGAGAGSGTGRSVLRSARYGVPFALIIVLVNALVTRDGLTVIMRLGDLPVLGQTDVTLEATVAGAVLGLRAVVLIMCAALYSAAVDPDQVLRAFRRLSFRSALSASLATRMVPVLVRDAQRLSDAQRCRPGGAPSRVAIMRATTSNVLDRALDVAAALEVRGYGAARRPPHVRRPVSRHDLAFAAAAAAIAATAVVARIGGLEPFAAYPALSVPAGPVQLAVAAGLIVLALLPFADRRGVAR